MEQQQQQQQQQIEDENIVLNLYGSGGHSIIVNRNVELISRQMLMEEISKISLNIFNKIPSALQSMKLSMNDILYHNTCKHITDDDKSVLSLVDYIEQTKYHSRSYKYNGIFDYKINKWDAENMFEFFKGCRKSSKKLLNLVHEYRLLRNIVCDTYNIKFEDSLRMILVSIQLAIEFDKKVLERNLRCLWYHHFIYKESTLDLPAPPTFQTDTIHPSPILSYEPRSNISFIKSIYDYLMMFIDRFIYIYTNENFQDIVVDGSLDFHILQSMKEYAEKIEGKRSPQTTNYEILNNLNLTDQIKICLFSFYHINFYNDTICNRIKSILGQIMEFLPIINNLNNEPSHCEVHQLANHVELLFNEIGENYLSYQVNKCICEHDKNIIKIMFGDGIFDLKDRRLIFNTIYPILSNKLNQLSTCSIYYFISFN